MAACGSTASPAWRMFFPLDKRPNLFNRVASQGEISQSGYLATYHVSVRINTETLSLILQSLMGRSLSATEVDKGSWELTQPGEI